MRPALLLSLALCLPATAGTLFDENGNKIEVCKGSTCSPSGGGGNPPGTIVTINQDGTVKLSSSNTATSSSTSQGGTAYGGAGGNSTAYGGAGGNSTASSTSQGGTAYGGAGGNSTASSTSQGGTAYGGAGGEGGAGGNSTASSTSQGGTAYGGAGGKGGSATSTSQGGNANITFTTPRSQTIRSVGVAPDIVANPTAPCRVSAGVTGGWIGGALGFTGSVLDEGCDARADATMLWAMGLEGAAITRLCQKPEMTKALGHLCSSELSPTSSTAFNH